MARIDQPTFCLLPGSINRHADPSLTLTATLPCDELVTLVCRLLAAVALPFCMSRQRSLIRVSEPSRSTSSLMQRFFRELREITLPVQDARIPQRSSGIYIIEV